MMKHFYVLSLTGAAVTLSSLGSAIATPIPPSRPLPLLRTEPIAPLNAEPEQQYLLDAGDQIQITVANYDEFNGQRVIMPDGTITIPLIGGIKAAGLTPDVLAQQLQTRLNKLVIDPRVTVSLTGLRPVLVSIAGEVQRPGPRQFEGSEAKANVLSALAAAGGITRDADLSQVELKRRLPNGTVASRTIDLWKVVNSEQLPADLTLRDGDAILVPKLQAGTSVDRRAIARSSLSPNSVRVRVVGEVTRPGEIQVTPDSSLSSAIAIAGGPTDDAKLNEVKFIRVNPQGQAEEKTLDMQTLTDATQVQDGDVLIVPKKPVARTLNTAGKLFAPLTFLLRLVGLF